MNQRAARAASVGLERGETIAWLVSSAVVAALVGGSSAPVITNDGIQYLSQADHLMAGRGLQTSFINFDVEFSHGTVPAPLTTFPPGYAIASAPLRLMGVSGPWAAGVISLLARLALVPLLLWGASILGLTRNATRAVLLLAMANAQLLGYSLLVQTESLFTLLVLATTVLVVRYEREPEGSRHLGVLALAAVCAGVSYWVRYAGLFVAAALAAYYGGRFLWRRTASALVAALVAASGVLWVGAGLARNAMIAGTIRGGNDKPVWHPVSEVAPTLAKVPGEVLFGAAPFQTAPWMALELVVTVAVAWLGQRLVAAAAHRRAGVEAPAEPFWRSPDAAFAATLVGLYVAGIVYLGFTTVITLGARLFVPLLPVVLLALGRWFSAVDRAVTPAPHTPGVRWAQVRSAKLVLGAAGAFYVLVNLGSAVADLRVSDPLTEVRRCLEAPTDAGHSLRAWIESHVSKDARLLASHGQLTGFALGRPTLSMVGSQFSAQVWSDEHARAVAQRFAVDYLIVYPGQPGRRAGVQQETPFLAALVEGRPPPWLTLAAGNGCGTVYRRQR